MIGIYVRVSTVCQNAAGQKREIRRWLKGNGIDEKDVEWYVGKATGNNLDRPELERLQRDIFSGEIETVVVWKLDRLSRNLREGINVLADWCDRGLRFVSITQQIDFNGALGKMLAAVLLGLLKWNRKPDGKGKLPGLLQPRNGVTFTADGRPGRPKRSRPEHWN